MKKVHSKLFKSFGLVLAGVLLFGIVAAPISAQNSKSSLPPWEQRFQELLAIGNPLTSADLQELSAMGFVASNANIQKLINLGFVASAEDYQTLSDLRLDVAKKCEEEIRRQMMNALSTQPIYTIAPNSKTTYYFNDSTIGFYWAEHSGINWGINYTSKATLQGNLNEAVGYIGHGLWGAGSGAAISYVGCQIGLSGNSTVPALITMSGQYAGDMTAGAAGLAYAGVDISLVVIDHTTGTEFPLTIVSDVIGLNSIGYKTTSFNKGFTVMLTSGHIYGIYLRLEASAELVGIGFANSEWLQIPEGHPFGDAGGAWYSTISITIN